MSPRASRTSATPSATVTLIRGSLMAPTAWRSTIRAEVDAGRQGPEGAAASRRRGARRRRRRRPPDRRSGPAASPAGRAPSARRRGGRAPRSRRGRRARRAARRPTASSRGSEPSASATSAKKASSDSGLFGPSPRSTSRHWTLPEPSQIEFSGRLAEQPRHPRLLDVAVAAEALERLDGVRRRALGRPVLDHRVGDPLERAAPPRRPPAPRRRRAPAASRRPSPPRTRSRGRRARSASAAGRSAGVPNAERCAAWWIACATPTRIPAAAPIAQSSRVWLTISMIVGTPRPSSPTSRAQAPRNSTSHEAFERLPSLSLSRWMWKRLRSPSGVKRGIRKQESPPSVWARTRKASHIGADRTTCGR